MNLQYSKLDADFVVYVGMIDADFVVYVVLMLLLRCFMSWTGAERGLRDLWGDCVTWRAVLWFQDRFCDFRRGFAFWWEVAWLDERFCNVNTGCMTLQVLRRCSVVSGEAAYKVGEIACLEVRLRDPMTQGFEIWTPNIDSVKAGDTRVCRACGNFIGISFANLWLFAGFVSDSQNSFGESKKYL